MVAIETRQLISNGIPGASWAVVIAQRNGSEYVAKIFLANQSDSDGVVAGQGAGEISRQNVGGSPIFTWKIDNENEIFLKIQGKSVSLQAQNSEQDLFAGLNVGVAIRNGENVQAVADWIAHHHRHQGMTGALIVDRCRDPNFASDLANLVSDLDMARVLVVTPDFPLGQPGLPAEEHPYCAPDAPGKDRMKIPAADRWRSPLGESSIYEMLKEQYLGSARAVANLEASDLLMPGSANIFDAAVASESGAVALSGRRCYPWRVRKNQNVTFGDHICVQFDQSDGPRRWCLAPGKVGAGAIWRFVRVVGIGSAPVQNLTFMRFMGLRHSSSPVSKIVPKSSLVEDPVLLQLAKNEFAHKPVRMPVIKMPKVNAAKSRTAIVTTMKNEGPFILEWLAYHRVVGVKDFLIYTNDCTDGTDSFLQLLQDKGIVQHRENDFRKTGLKPQHSALRAAEKEPVISDADWVICMDVDEFINIKIGDGTLAELYAHMGDANMISCTWRLFGNADIQEFTDEPVIKTFDRCATEYIRKPHQAWGFKTLFRNIGIFRKLGVHRPKGLNPQLWDQIRWVNGSGKPLPASMFRNAWRSTQSTYGYDVVSLNHYAVRSAESFLVKRDRGRVNHVDRDQGLSYWFRMNNNAEQDNSIQRMLPKLDAEMAQLLSDPDIAAAHADCVSAHRKKIAELKKIPKNAEFFEQLSSVKMQRLSRMHQYFGAKVFQAGPEIVPDEIALAEEPGNFMMGVTSAKTTS